MTISKEDLIVRTIRRNIARNAKKYAAKATVSAMMLAGGVMMASPILSSTVSAATEHWNDASASKTESWSTWKANWDKYSTNYENVSLTPGATESQLNFAYYSKTEETPKVKIATKADMSDAKEVEGKQTQAVAIEGVQYYSNKASVNDLKENTTYYYQVFQNGKYQDVQKYSTKSFKNYSFLYVGDPQIGASSGQTSTEGDAMKDNNYAARNDSYNWNNVLNNAVKQNPNLSFVASAGDQVNTGNNEKQYAGYLGADALRSLPVATTIGNHDSGSEQYSMHYNNPNAFDTSGYRNTAKYTEGKTAAGTDYYYTYGNTLFIILDTNNYNCATHENVMRKAIKENPNAKWKVVMFHQDIYGSAEHSNEPEITNLRYQLTPIFEQNDIDAVLTGHDHAYSRSKMLLGGTKANDYTDDEFDAELEKDMDAGENPTTKTVAPGNIKNDSTDEKDQKYLTYLKSIMDEKAIETVKKQGSSVINPEGVLYMTAGSSSGSKYYDLVPRQQTYIAHRWQEDVPTYSVVDVTENSLTINTYRTDNDEKIDETFSITKSKGDTTSLNAEIKASESIVKQKDAYTTESYRVFEQALTGAKEVAADKKATKDEVENALKVLTNAKAGLEKKATTKPATVKKPTAEKKVVVAKASAKLKAGKKKVTVKIKKASVSGYQIKYASNKNFKKAKTRNTRKTIYTIKSLRSKKKCYVKVRAYKVVKGKKIYGSYSKVLKVTVK